METKMTNDLLAKFFSGNCSEAEKEKVELWKSKSRKNEQYYDEYLVLWRNAKGKSSFKPDVEAALKQVNNKLGFTESKHDISRGQVVRFTNYAIKIAASVLFIVGCFWAYHLAHQEKHNQSAMMIIGASKKCDLVLSDGTHVWLNSGSKFQYPREFSQKERRVLLEGEAYFVVSKNPLKPFIIETGNVYTKVLGTRFNVRARKGEEKVTVTVSEGKVALADKDDKGQQQIKLLPGDEGTYFAKSKTLKTEKNSDPNFMAWKTGQLVFKNTPLDQVIKTLSETYGVTIENKLPATHALTFTSTFDNKSLTDVLEIMKLSLSIKVEKVGDKIIIID